MKRESIDLARTEETRPAAVAPPGGPLRTAAREFPVFDADADGRPPEENAASAAEREEPPCDSFAFTKP